MGFINSLLGGESGNTGGAGMRYQADLPNVTSPVTSQEANQAYNQTQNGISQQQAFLNALAQQNGIQNQSNVFNQQQALAGQLQGVANGTGPNPAQAQLAQATGQNVAQQAALMAGQRGAGANVGLLARQIANQGAGIQQQAVGQGATLQAQQQLAALGALQGQQANMANLASQQVGQQAGAVTGYNQAAQGQQQNLLNSIAGVNSANVNAQNSANAANAHISGITAQNQGSLLGGAISGVGSALGGLSHGGMIDSYAQGGSVAGPMSNAGQYLYGNQGSNPLAQGMNNLGAGIGSAIGSMFNTPTPEPMTIGGNDPSDYQNLGTGNSPWDYKSSGGTVDLKGGGKVGGKAKAKGDNYSNDTVPAMLSPKEIVIPRSITMGPNAPENAAKFVAAILAKQGMTRGKT